MTNSTKNTTKSIFLALSVAMTMGAASATTVPGIPGDVFEFSQPGLAPNMVVTGSGVDAVANINAILEAVGTSGGSTLDVGNFWGASVEKTRSKVFEYNDAAPMIEELIFTVTGQAHNGAEYVDARNVVVTKVVNNVTVVTNARDEFLSKSSNTTAGSYVDGKLAHTQAKAMELLRLLNFTANDATESIDAAGTVINAGGVAITGPHSTDLGTKVTGGTWTDKNADGTATYNHDSAVEIAVEAASLNKTGFNNANELIALIADQLKTGYILDVDKATETLAAIAGHHNGFLSASLVSEAHGLKDVIKFIGYQKAAVGLGKGAAGACTGGTGSTLNGIDSGTSSSEACVSVGQEFNKLMAKIPAITTFDGSATSSDIADSYESSIANIVAFADNIIGFNKTVNGFDPATEAALIKGQFGTITVDEESQLYDNLEQNGDANALAPTYADIASGVVASDIEGFETELFIVDLGDDDAVGGIDGDADTTTSVIFE